ncbi:MAG: hypothetical protein KJ069_09945 [Anaerolineae bacterium]|nr:hypothetical protein [Anaerolineae bacterium]
MNRLSIVMLFVTACTLFLGGCSQSTAEIAGTVESQVAVAVMGTVEAWPTAVPLNTYTPIPSATPQATYTPYPTYTPLPTFTPQATYTPYPTWTPTPEDTATAVPTTTPTSPPSPQATAVPPTTSPTTTNLTALKTEIANTLSDINIYRGGLTRWVGINRYELVNCRENVDTYDRIVMIITLDVSSDDAVIQNAYAVYQDAVNQFAEFARPWTDSCREALANGIELKPLDNLQRGTLTNSIAIVESRLNSVNDQLNALGE